MHAVYLVMIALLLSIHTVIMPILIFCCCVIDRNFPTIAAHPLLSACIDDALLFSLINLPHLVVYVCAPVSMAHAHVICSSRCDLSIPPIAVPSPICIAMNSPDCAKLSDVLLVIASINWLFSFIFDLVLAFVANNCSLKWVKYLQVYRFRYHEESSCLHWQFFWDSWGFI